MLMHGQDYANILLGPPYVLMMIIGFGSHTLYQCLMIYFLFWMPGRLGQPTRLGDLSLDIYTYMLFFMCFLNFYTLSPSLLSFGRLPQNFLSLLLHSVISCFLLSCTASVVVICEFSQPHDLTGFLKKTFEIWKESSKILLV